MENQEDELSRWLRVQLAIVKSVRDALLDEAQQMDVIAEALELLISGGRHHGSP